LRATDAGRIVGPKAANLGELSSRYPGMVSAGLAIPFGVYRSVLERPGPDGRQSMYDWLQQQHRLLQRIDDPGQRARTLSSFLQRARDWFATVEFPVGFFEALREQAATVF